ncbi:MULTISPECIES: GtrA family protein [Halorubrum]|jgi:putative flippase GtrA|uniref:Polysaccharide biosynthesis protein GtrA n=1 Tax=Halorubrum tropicale TaxID=1765655 RepID=A0A0M9ANJ8_9EURY|nr:MULTISPECIES: GtrA family protein [Halorubrum]KOX95677.1 polysaccharide biosynthesis protein GtrA [Halorubrum tropicale]RLM51130.1 GtrA family protein [Halorubrum sp. Atlit-28R]TKX45181.1 GtrA family protein [Halorubrum sp. ARQ200]TKX51658.1 GtrA family protein [Halorubrum sp. ASP121]TKX61137.1 GtrA family protein [Halorubrum sp. ASP1]
MIRAVLRDLASGPIAVQMRRFVVVGALTAALQLALLWLFVDTAGLNYLVGAAVAIEITIVCSYVLNNAWTFRASRNTGVSEYLTGLLKTNLVRGTAIPIQLGVLAALVEWGGVMYLVANVVAIIISGLYRFVLDAQWTWG